VSSRLIVLERDGHWAAALRREFDEAAVRITETRSWDEMWQLLAQSPGELVAAELSAANPERMFAALAQVERRHPQAAIIVLADRRLAPYRDLLLEAGALHFITSPRRLHEIRGIVKRRAARFGVTAHDRLDEIRNNLPWTELGAGDWGLGTGDAPSPSAKD
jgi:DNA-binding NarL/FixJ family response regulator